MLKVYNQANISPSQVVVISISGAALMTTVIVVIVKYGIGKGAVIFGKGLTLLKSFLL